MAHNIFKGLGIALITPFQEDGSVDYKSLIRLVEYQLNNGADFFCILATTGETPTLSAEEKSKIKNLVVDLVGGRVPILMGCGGYNTAAIVEELRTGDFRGIDGILSVCPYYNKPSQEGLYQHFKTIAAATTMPVVLYNVPGRTGTNCDAETTLALAHDVPNIVAVKEASGKLDQIQKIIEGAPAGFSVLSGNDDETLSVMRMGGHGVVSVASNVAPLEMALFLHAAQSGDWTRAEELNERMSALFKNLFVEPNPIPGKAAMAQLGLMENSLRLPLVTALESTEALMKQTLNQLWA